MFKVKLPCQILLLDVMPCGLVDMIQCIGGTYRYIFRVDDGGSSSL